VSVVLKESSQPQSKLPIIMQSLAWGIAVIMEKLSAVIKVFGGNSL
jgi:hypothetical protein